MYRVELCYSSLLVLNRIYFVSGPNEGSFNYILHSKLFNTIEIQGAH